MPRHAAPLLIAAVSTVLGCHTRASAAECDRVFRHYVELLVRQENPDLEGERLRAQVESTRARASTERSFDSCPRELLKDDAECALAANSVDELERCIE